VFVHHARTPGFGLHGGCHVTETAEAVVSGGLQLAILQELRNGRERPMATTTDREKLIADLNGDLSREYQAIIAYVIYSQTIKGAAFMAIARELESHAKEELSHAITISKQIDYLGGNPTATPKDVKLSEKAEDMLRFDLDNETETVRNYRHRIRQCEALGEYAMAEEIRKILANEQEHQIDLATALGIDVPLIEPKDAR
jgi:bacterioferritin